jgi:murein DD-endopeptidase MepM/ murein hydrolase activator NlpD
MAKKFYRFYRKISQGLRRLAEKRQIRRLFGINLMASSLLFSVVSPAATAFSENPVPEITNINPAIAQLTTERSVRTPTENFKINQRYSFFHPGIDLGGILGGPIYPIMTGTVEQTTTGRVAYGNYIIVNHGSGFKSLYAHLSKIIANEGQEVDKNTVIGLLGSTGWSTGPHLHFEVWDNDRPFNPLTILK